VTGYWCSRVNSRWWKLSITLWFISDGGDGWSHRQTGAAAPATSGHSSITVIHALERQVEAKLRGAAGQDHRTNSKGTDFILAE
jgi:hypothetical protein